jgi:putative acetyltransferase
MSRLQSSAFNSMHSIRPEQPADAAAIHELLAAAFPTPAEARLVDALRASGDLLVSLVAEAAGQTVGHIAFSPVTIGAGPDQARGVGMAPVAVAADWRRRGIGGQLIRQGIAACRALGLPWIVVLGDPAYYCRFGFGRAADRDIANEYGADEDFRVIELLPGSLPAAGGMARYGAEFAGMDGEPPGES